MILSSVGASVCLWRSEYTVAKRYKLEQMWLNKWIGNASIDTILQISTSTPTLFPQTPHPKFRTFAYFLSSWFLRQDKKQYIKQTRKWSLGPRASIWADVNLFILYDINTVDTIHTHSPRSAGNLCNHNGIYRSSHVIIRSILCTTFKYTCFHIATRRFYPFS